MALSLWEHTKAGLSKVVFFNVLLTGSLLLMSMTSPNKAKKKNEMPDSNSAGQHVNNEKGVQTTAIATNGATKETIHTSTENRPSSWKARVLGFLRMLQWRPSSALVPTITTALIMVQVFKVTTSLDMSFGDVDKFKQTCPLNGRRTPYETLVKLSTTAILTVGVNVHHRFLIGGQSWKRDAIRMLEIIISPLSTLVNFALMISYEIASTFKSSPRLWHDEPGYTYRLGRMLSCRIDSTQSESGQCVRYVNPKHIELSHQSRAQSLRLYGRTALILVLMVHYLQVSTLFFRRLASGTYAVLDLATLFLAISAFVALIQSLLITIFAPQFSLRSEFKPCAEKACLLESCKNHKLSMNLTSDTHERIILGYNWKGVLRQLLHGFMGASLMSMLMYPESKGIWPWWPLDIASRVYGVYLAWKAPIYIAVVMSITREMMTDYSKGTPQKDNATMEVQSAFTSKQLRPVAMGEKEGDKIPEDSSSQRPAAASTWRTKLIDASIQIAFFCGGIVILLFFLFCILFQFLNLFLPIMGLGFAIADETVKMAEWNATTPCPRMWKDPLSTKLWGF